ncbi:MAG: thermonuclease family protein [Methylotenera sp.]|nr:thermonuclease family protein [Methylotenera sp.]
MIRLISLIFLLVSPPCFADALLGVVIGVKDGDTIELLTPERKKIVVRLNAIDAPEKKQAFGNKSKQSLANLCAGKDATVNVGGLDKYGRTIGELFCEGKSANVHQIENGFAWVYRKYSNDGNLIALETAAKSSGRGLWNDPLPVAPWDFRQGVKPETFERARVRLKASAKSGEGFSCGSKNYCREMSSCAEARFYLTQCGLNKLDRDRDGVPCEAICSL